MRVEDFSDIAAGCEGSMHIESPNPEHQQLSICADHPSAEAGANQPRSPSFLKDFMRS
jgi:hypothetical protein